MQTLPEAMTYWTAQWAELAATGAMAVTAVLAAMAVTAVSAVTAAEASVDLWLSSDTNRRNI